MGRSRRALVGALPLGALLLLLSGCPVNHTAPPDTPLKSGGISTTWSVGCNMEISFWKSIYVWWRGKQALSPGVPCKKLQVRSVHKFNPISGVEVELPKNQVFRQLAKGKVANWFWKVAATPSVARTWKAAKASGRVAGAEQADLQAYWPLLFRDIYSVYCYVLAKPPPDTRFILYLYPDDEVIDRTIVTSTGKGIVLPFFIPYSTKGVSWPEFNLDLDARQAAYHSIATTTSFEYMHALFFSKETKLPNLLGQSVAGAVIKDVLLLLYWQKSEHLRLVLPSAEQALSLAEKKKDVLLQQGAVDLYGSLLALANMANVLGAREKGIIIHPDEHAKIQRLLKLARAMMQKPIDFTKVRLYPLGWLDTIQDYSRLDAVKQECSVKTRNGS